MKRRKNLKVLEIAGDYLLVPVGDGPLHGGTIVLNEVSAFLLKAMETDISQNQLLEKLLAEYAVDQDTAARDLERILKEFQRLGVLEMQQEG